MVFSSILFVFLFLPLLMAVHFFARTTTQRNAILLVASLAFYAWGETWFVLAMLASIAVNYAIGLMLDAATDTRRRKRLVTLGVVANLLFLGAFKYANFLADNINLLLKPLGMPLLELGPVHLPAGISFFTFQAMTYVVDLYRGDSKVQKNPASIALYISLFPQLIAGPIVRYHDIAEQLGCRAVTLENTAIGIRRFVMGLVKKVLVANLVAVPADAIFALDPASVSTPLAWFGVFCYALQIYFDFSGYSDMAIGLGRMFGFRFPENFNYPYVSRSIREFWRRWHITLSSWFRDYLYIPLGGNRKGPWRTCFNLLTVFVLCGLWHGASWNFIIWGAYHGAFLVAERGAWGRWLVRLPGPLRHIYTLFVVTIGWVWFRTDTVGHASGYLDAMFTASPEGAVTLAEYASNDVIYALAWGALFSLPIVPLAQRWHASIETTNRFCAVAKGALLMLAGLLLMFLFIVCVSWLAGGTYNPFIYFRF